MVEMIWNKLAGRWLGIPRVARDEAMVEYIIAEQRRLRDERI